LLLLAGCSLLAGFLISELRQENVVPVTRAAPMPVEPQLTRTGTTECRWTAEPITLDGVADEAAWKQAQPVTNFTTYWAKRRGRTPTVAKLLWDDKYLYFYCDMQDDDLYADVTEHDGNTWENDVFELFFRPDPAKLPYYEFEVSVANTKFDMFTPSRGSGHLRRWLKARNFGWETAVKPRGKLNTSDISIEKADGWSVEGRFPWSDFAATGGKPAAGSVWHFALCRYDYSRSYLDAELTCTAPLTQPNFHRIEDYTPLRFVKAAE
jgi:hypothetical protein